MQFSFECKTYQIVVKGGIGYGLRGAAVTVCRDLNKQIKVWYNNRYLTYKEFIKEKQPVKIVSSKEIAVVASERKYKKPDENHPWKKSNLWYMSGKIKR